MKVKMICTYLLYDLLKKQTDLKNARIAYKAKFLNTHLMKLSEKVPIYETLFRTSVDVISPYKCFYANIH